MKVQIVYGKISFDFDGGYRLGTDVPRCPLSHKAWIVVLMITHKKILGAGLVALLLCLAVIPIFQASAQQQDKDRAERFVQIADRSREYVVSIRDMVASKGVSTSKMDGLIAEADSLLEEAKTFLANTKLPEAIAKATAAMRKYTEAIKSLGETLRPQEQEVEREKAEVEMREAGRIERIRVSVKAVPNAPQAIMKEVNERLVEAEGAMKSKPVNRPEAQRMEQKPQAIPADSMTYEALLSVRKLTLDFTMVNRINGYLRGVDPQIKKIADDIGNIAKMGANVESVQKKFTELQGLVESTKKKVDNNDVNGALKDISKIQELLSRMRMELITISRPLQAGVDRGP